jgi:peptidoglycan/LPS O-acetylase OafA/YrhL
LPGFFLLGLLFSFPGTILPAWGYHLTGDYESIGVLFLALGGGVLSALRPSRELLRRRPVNQVMALACGIAFAALMLLSWFSPPASLWWQVGGVFLVGFGGSMLSSAAFHFV